MVALPGISKIRRRRVKDELKVRRTIALAACRAPLGFVAGVDVSERMHRMATRYNREHIRQGRVELRVAGSGRLLYADGYFDKVYSAHTIYFWPNPAADLREIGRVMKAGVRLVLGFRPKDEGALADFPTTVYSFYSVPQV